MRKKGFLSGSVFGAVLIALISASGAADVPLFTDEELKRYKSPVLKDQPPIPPGRDEPVAVRNVPMGRDDILGENDGSVGVIVAIDEQGKVFSRGTAFALAADGAVVTGYHVLSNASAAKVRIGATVYQVEGVLHVDREHDIVILKVGGKGLRAVRTGDSRRFRTDEPVYLMDNPGGKENRISEGTVAGFRDVGGKRMIQLDLSFSSGSSGAPVFNQSGEVIGVASMTVSDGRPVSFAVPIDVIKERFTPGPVIPLKEALYRDRRQAVGYWIAVADGHYQEGRIEEAVRAYRQAIDADPDSAAAYNGLGVAYAGLKQYREAAAAYQQSIKLDPGSAWARSNLGLIYMELKMFKEAVEVLREAVRIMPDLSGAHYNLGLAYSRSQQYREAAASYNEAIRLRPGFADAHLGLGLVYLALHDRSAARQQYEFLQKLDPAQAAKLWERIKE
jgi:S1-C subfamily serine protease